MSVISLDDVRAHLQMTPGSGDPQVLQGIIDAAEGIVSKWVGPLSSITPTVSVVAGGPGFVLPSTTTAVASAVRTDIAGSTPVTTGFVVHPGGVITNAGCAQGVWSITHTSGWVTLPPALRLAVLELVRHLHRPQRAARTDDITQDGPGYLVPNRVRELLSPYTLPGIA